jgi:hypothetical protein
MVTTEPKRINIRIINMMKAEMYKYLHEIKDNTDKKLNELREDTN